MTRWQPLRLPRASSGTTVTGRRSRRLVGLVSWQHQIQGSERYHGAEPALFADNATTLRFQRRVEDTPSHAATDALSSIGARRTSVYLRLSVRPYTRVRQLRERFSALFNRLKGQRCVVPCWAWNVPTGRESLNQLSLRGYIMTLLGELVNYTT